MSEPVPMRLTCPECGELHVDVGEFATKVHHTHSCQYCGMTWRPAVAPTVGVQFLPGFQNVSPPPLTFGDGSPWDATKVRSPTLIPALEPIPVQDVEHAAIASAINCYYSNERGPARPMYERDHRWLDAAARSLREVVANDVAQVKAANRKTPIGKSCPYCKDSLEQTVTPHRCATMREQGLDGYPPALSLARSAARENIHRQIDEERGRQDKQWGGSHHDDAHARLDWLKFIDEHNVRAKKAIAPMVGRGTHRERTEGWTGQEDEYRKQLVEVAALAIAAIESHDRKRTVGR